MKEVASQIIDKSLQGFINDLPEVASGEWMRLATSWYWVVYQYQEVFLIVVEWGDSQGYGCRCVSLYTPSHGDTLPWEKNEKERRIFFEGVAEEKEPLPVNVERIHIHFNYF